MLFTNGSKIVIADGHIDNLDKFMKDIQKRYREYHGEKDVKFSFSDSPFPHYTSNKPFTFEKLSEAAEGITEVGYRAIGDERITLPGRKKHNIKHYFNEEELINIAEESASMDQKIHELSGDMQRVVKQYKDEISELQGKISHNHSLIRQKHEVREMDTLVDLDFVEKQKLYLHPDSGEVLHSEPLKGDDYQMKMFYTDGFFEAAQPEISEPATADIQDEEEQYDEP